MSYYIFLKSLRSIEEFRKNPHVKIPPKSSSTNFPSLGKFKNPIFIRKDLFPPISAHSAQPACPLPRPWPAGRPKPPRPELPAHAASQPARPRAPLAYFAEAVFIFGSRLPEPAASPAFR
jgi:hypothetical protein